MLNVMGNTLYIQGKCLQDIGNIIAFQGNVLG